MLLTENRSYKLSVEKIGNDLEDFLSKDTLMDFTTLELLYDTVTCSFPVTRLLSAYTRKRREELYLKCALLENALTEKEEYLGKSSQVAFLDSVEKSVISYYLGMIFTKLIARRFFDADYLVHFQLLPKEMDTELQGTGSRRRVEMLGYSVEKGLHSIWVSKGRSNNSLEALREGVLQAGEICSMNGQPLEMAAVCMTYYERGFLAGKIQGAQGKGSLSGQVPFASLCQAYYTPLRELFFEYYNREEMRDVRWLGEDFVEVELVIPYFLKDSSQNAQSRSFVVGMPRVIVEQAGEGMLPMDRWKALQELFVKQWGSDFYFGRDFVYVRNLMEKNH